MKYYFKNENCNKFPRMVIAGLSFACNAKCIHCIYSEFPETKAMTAGQKLFMDMAVFKIVADECSRHPWNLLRLVGFGEPMMHPQFIEMVAYAKNAGCNVGVITNGSLLDEKMAEMLLQTNIDAIDVSVDAFSKETYELIRKGLSFEQLVQNVRILVDKRNSLKKSTFIFCSIVEQEEVNHEINEALQFWGEIADKAVSRKFLTFGLFDKDEARTPYYEERIPCFLLYDRINIDVGGQIRLCGYDSSGKTDFGSVLNTSIGEVWQGDELNRLRMLHQERRFDEAGLCASCVDWPFHSWVTNYMQDSFGKRKGA